MEKRSDIKKSSQGTTTFFFEPNPDKSFRRSATDYFLNGRHRDISQPETPKSVGEEIGIITYVSAQYIEIKTEKDIHNGDGLCFFAKDGTLSGFRVNRVEGKKIFPAEMPVTERNILLYRNQDHEFDKILAGKTSERKIGVDIRFSETSDGFSIQITDEEGISAGCEFVSEKQPANNAERALQTIESQLTKLGNTIYTARNVDISVSAPRFLPASALNEWRRKTIELLDEKRLKAYITRKRKPANTEAVFPEKKLTYLGNVTNERAREFYLQHGVEEIMPGFEVIAEPDVPLMFCKHCIKYSLGWCPKEGYRATFREPLYITYKNQQFQLEFDCRKCEMMVKKRKD